MNRSQLIELVADAPAVPCRTMVVIGFFLARVGSHFVTLTIFILVQPRVIFRVQSYAGFRVPFLRLEVIRSHL